jgi:hypothetical protein
VLRGPNESRRLAITDLLHGGYYTYEANPGTLNLFVDVNKSIKQLIPLLGAAIEAASRPEGAKLEMQLSAGETYYVRVHPDVHFTHFTPTLLLVPNDVGLKEIAACKLISDDE